MTKLMTRLPLELDTQVWRAATGTFFEQAGLACGGVERLIELNLRSARETLVAEQSFLARGFVAQDPQAWFTLQTDRVVAAAEKFQAYGRHLLDLSLGTRAEFAHAGHGRCEVYQEHLQALVETMSKAALVNPCAAIGWKLALGSSALICKTL